jgi:hypothetical protein
MIAWTNGIEATGQSWSLKRKLVVPANFEPISKNRGGFAGLRKEQHHLR